MSKNPLLIGIRYIMSVFPSVVDAHICYILRTKILHQTPKWGHFDGPHDFQGLFEGLRKSFVVKIKFRLVRESIGVVGIRGRRCVLSDVSISSWTRALGL